MSLSKFNRVYSALSKPALSKSLSVSYRQITPVTIPKSQQRNKSDSRSTSFRKINPALIFSALVGASLVTLYVLDDDNVAHADEQPKKRKRLVVLGTGWACLSLLQKLDANLYDVVVVSPRNYFLYTPLLASSTVGTVEHRSITEPIRAHLSTDAEFIQGKCTDVDFNNKTILIKSDDDSLATLPYDQLVISVGAFSNTFGVPGVKENCLFLKSVEESRKVRDHIMMCLEKASFPSTSEEEKKRLCSFLVVGGGPTGVEFSGELSDFMVELKRWYPKLSDYMNVTIIQSGDHILNAYDRSISEYAESNLRGKRVNVLTNARVLEVTPEGVGIQLKGKPKELLPYGVCIWCTGIMAPPLIETLIKKIPEQNHSKVLKTDSFLRVLGVKDVFALGDCATVAQPQLLTHFVELFKEADVDGTGELTLQEFTDLVNRISPQYPQLAEYGKRVQKIFIEADTNKDNLLQLEEFKAFLKLVDSKITVLPATAACAGQEGNYLGIALNHLEKGENISPFKFNFLGQMSYVGGDRAVGDIMGKWKVTGFGTWWLWRANIWIKQFSMRNRVNIMLDWMKTIIFGRDISKF